MDIKTAHLNAFCSHVSKKKNKTGKYIQAFILIYIYIIYINI